VHSSGYVPSHYDPRDRLFAGWAVEPGNLSVEVPTEVRDQGEVPCCVAMAVTAAVEVVLARRGEPVVLSPMHLYWHARPGTGLSELDVRSALDVARRFGIASFQAFPVGEDPYAEQVTAFALVRPSPEHDLEATGHKVERPDEQYSNVPIGARVRRWRAALTLGVPIVFGFEVPPSYDALGPDDPILRPDGPSLTRHCALVVGWADGLFEVRDSQGRAFGRDGHWWLSDSLVASSFVLESWVLR
jgi:hypothetical protein